MGGGAAKTPFRVPLIAEMATLTQVDFPALSHDANDLSLLDDADIGYDTVMPGCKVQ